MTRQLFINPSDVRKPDLIRFSDIPVNQYQRTIAEETESYSPADFLRIYRDMRLIREFETMLYEIKTTNQYRELNYNNPGPAHLSIGQEAAAVGQAYLLTEQDFIFGSHRSHGEILAKGLSAIHHMNEQALQQVMEQFLDGAVWRVVEQQSGRGKSLRELAVDFLVYGALAEIFARTTGFNRGLGGSMHAFFLPFGVYPNNAIVGGSADISVGAALFKKINRRPGLVICNIGDGSLGCGPVWEAFMMATMDQFRQLWPDDMKGGLPLIFNIMNNQYAMGGQTRGETMGYEMAARLGAGINPDQMHAERIDGYQPLAVIDAIRRKREVIEQRRGPVLLDTLTYRYAGHSPSDADSYRTEEEKAAWEAEDSISSFRQQLLDAAVAKPEDFAAIDQQVIETIERTTGWAIDADLSPRMNLRRQPDAIASLMFSNQSIARMDDRPADMLQTREENPRVKQIARRQRFAFDEQGQAIAKNRVYQLRDALFEAILDKFYEDPTLVAYGEENRDWGGAFAVYRGLTEAVPYHRLFNSPISEGAIVGSAVGYAMSGGRALVELMYSDFLGRAGDEVFNQLPKWQAMSAGILRMPVVLRVSVGSKYGAQHSQDWTALCTHIPGLKVVFPVTPYDAKGLMTSALNGTDPVIFFESQRLYDIGEQFHAGGVPETSYEIAIGEPDVKRAGSDLTVLTIGATLYRALEAAEILERDHGVSVEVIDARSLVPFQYEKVIESVRKTGRIIVSGDACERGSYLNDLARTISDLCFDDLDAPVVVVGSRNWITPAFELEEYFFPQPRWLIDAYHQRIRPLPGYTPENSFTDTEMIRRSRQGV
ncbi:MAG: thiamine pyrophosphate-dependent enzyme [Eubacteriales bacterium]|nr:thiamine pyrophosphate-dependent enzyme [Eubacteriales bacterium]